LGVGLDVDANYFQGDFKSAAGYGFGIIGKYNFTERFNLMAEFSFSKSLNYDSSQSLSKFITTKDYILSNGTNLFSFQIYPVINVFTKGDYGVFAALGLGYSFWSFNGGKQFMLKQSDGTTIQADISSFIISPTIGFEYYYLKNLAFNAKLAYHVPLSDWVE